MINAAPSPLRRARWGSWAVRTWASRWSSWAPTVSAGRRAARRRAASPIADAAEPARRCAVLQEFDYVFSENGLVAYKDAQLLAEQVRGGCHRRRGALRRPQHPPRPRSPVPEQALG